MNTTRKIMYALYAEESNRSCWTEEWLQERENKDAGLFSVIMKLAETKPDLFKNMMRMDIYKFNILANLIRPLIEKKNTNYRKSISVEERLAITIRFLSTGESMMSLHYQFQIGRSTISVIIYETLEALLKVLKDDYMKCPSSLDEWEKISNDFLERWQIPNTIGAVDGKHIEINHVRAAGSMYYNYKGHHSIILMAMVDANHRFLFIDVGVNGRASDGGVFSQTSLVQNIEDENNPLNIPPPKPLPGSDIPVDHVILGDDAFPLKNYLMKPYPKRTQTTDEIIYNYRQSRGRLVVENAFGILTARFRILLNRINLSPDRVDLVVWVCCCLHNMLVIDTPIINRPRERREMVGCSLSDMETIRGNRNSSSSRTNRDEFKKYFVNTGNVPWQWKKIPHF